MRLEMIDGSDEPGSRQRARGRDVCSASYGSSSGSTAGRRNGATARTVAYLADRSPTMAARAPVLFVPQQRRRDACPAGGSGARPARWRMRIDDTVAWLATPERWDTNARRGGSEEQPLARIQFASALASMVAAGRAGVWDALDRAAGLLVAHQHGDGSWRLSNTRILGGATFYGTSLATAMARRILERATTASVQSPLGESQQVAADEASPVTVLDASAVLLGLERDSDQRSRRPTTTVARHPPSAVRAPTVAGGPM